MNLSNQLKILTTFEQLINPSWGYKVRHNSLIGKLLRLCQDSLQEKWLEYAENIDKEVLAEYRLQQLRLLIRKAWELPFYRDIFVRFNIVHGKITDFSRLPVIHKRDFRSHQESDYVNLSLKNYDRTYWHRSSGSTGEPFWFLDDRMYHAQRRAFYYQTFRWLGISLEAKKVNFIVPWGSRRAWGNPANDKYLPVDNFQNKVEKYAEFITDFKPVILESNPSFLVFFAHYLNDKRKKLYIPYIVSHGEQISNEERQFLHETFSAEVTSYYGLAEFGTVGIECPFHNGFHINAFSYFVELVDEMGKALGIEKEGEIILTSFVNDIMPFIRYGTGDRGWWIKEPCPCGRSLPLLRVIGRRDDVLKLSNGRIIYMNFFHPIFYKHINKIVQFQIVQKSKNEVTVRIVPANTFSIKEEKDILNSLKELLGDGIYVTIHREKQIPWEKSGKFKSVIKL